MYIRTSKVHLCCALAVHVVLERPFLLPLECENLPLPGFWVTPSLVDFDGLSGETTKILSRHNLLLREAEEEEKRIQDDLRQLKINSSDVKIYE